MASSPSFRELDDVFLQSQARIWLAEMLHTRFDEQISICDLLADGELLFEVSKTFWNLLLVKYMELNTYKARMYIPVDTRKSSGRYRPYSNVDSFLKVCKVLGLSGVDLFSPSDVVDKRDTRKVCICIRSLSKKARSKQLNVPDFDIVTNTVAMPSDVVQCIRRSLELSTSSVLHGKSKHTRLKSSLVASHAQENEACHEESDESKSNFSDTSYADFLYLESGGSPKTVDNYTLTQGKQHAGVRNPDMDKFVPSVSAESLLLQYVCSDDQLDGIPSPVCESRLIICDEFTPINHEAKFWNDSLSDVIPFRILRKVPFHISEGCMCHSCMGNESHNSNETPNASTSRVWKKFPDDIEASPTSSVSSVVGRVLDFEFDFDATSEPYDLRTLVSGLCDLSKLENFDLSGDSFSPYWDDATSYISMDQDHESLNQTFQTERDLGNSMVLVKDNVTKVRDSIQATVLSKELNDKLMKGVEMAEAKDERKDVHIDSLVEADTNDKRTVNINKKSAYIALSLKTVVKGTALIGIFFMLRFRNRSDRNTNNKWTKKSSQIHWKSSGVVFSRRKGETGSKIYPVEKFKFGD